MPAKQKGASQKKRSQRQHSIEQQPLARTDDIETRERSTASAAPDSTNISSSSFPLIPTTSLTLPRSPLGGAASNYARSDLGDRAMQSRREFVFACLVGHRITVILKDGAEISGVFGLHGNASMLPSSWQQEARPANSSSPMPEHAFAYVSSGAKTSAPAALSSQIDDTEETGTWFVAGGKKKKGKKLLASVAVTGRENDSSVADDATSSSASSFAAPSSSDKGTFELYHSEARTANVKQPCIWLRCAHRIAQTLTKSSNVYDWLAVPWSDVICIEAHNIPDNPDDYKTRHVTSGFHTDGEIARTSAMIQPRELEKWDGGDDDMSGELLEDSALAWPACGPDDKLSQRETEVWDQFEYNAQKFGVRSTYVEGMYSTALDVNAIPEDYQKHAEKIADEVEHSNGRRLRVGGRHITAYRSDDEDDCEDEEAKFSAVAGTGRYVGKPFLGRTQQLEKTLQVPSHSRRGMPRGGAAGGGRGGRLGLMDVGRPPMPSDAQQGGYPGETKMSRGPQDEASYEMSKDFPGIYEGQNAYPTKILRPSQPPQQPPAQHKAAESHSSNAKGEDGQEETSQRNVKDNLNALNLEPTKTKKPLVPLKPTAELAAASRQKVRAEEVKKDRKSQKEQFLNDSKKIDMQLARRGWALMEQGNESHKEEMAPAATLPRPSTATSSGGAQKTETGTLLVASGTASPVVPTLPLTENEDHNSKTKGFQFNPNASSFTPKGNTAASPTVKPAEYDRQQSNGSTQQPPQRVPPTAPVPVATETNAEYQMPFLAFHTDAAELRRKGVTTKGPQSETEGESDPLSGGDHETFFDAIVKAARQVSETQTPAQIPPEWEPRLPMTSYLDYLNAAHCPPPIGLAAPVAAPASTATDTASSMQPTRPPQGAMPPQPQAQATASFSHMAPAMFGFPTVRSMFPQGAPFNPMSAGMDQPPQAMQAVFLNPARMAADPAAVAQMYHPFGQEYLNVAYGPGAAMAPQMTTKDPSSSTSVDQSKPRDDGSNAAGSSPSHEKMSSGQSELQKPPDAGTPAPMPTNEEMQMLQGIPFVSQQAFPTAGLHTLAGSAGQMPIFVAQHQSLLPSAFPPQVYLMYQQQALLQQQAAFQQLSKHPNLLPQQSVALVNPMQFLHQPAATTAMLSRPTAENAAAAGLRTTPSQTSLVGVPIDQHVPTPDAAGAPTMAYPQEGMFTTAAGYPQQMHMPAVFPGQAAAAGVFPNMRGLYWQQ